MKRLNSHQIGIDEGFVSLFDHWAQTTVMWDGAGERTVRATVSFDEPFAEPPTVSLSIAVLDADNESYLRLNLRTEDVTTTDFTIAADTWEDTRIARLGMRWTAIGVLVDTDELWDV
ncbi:H-type lectin domain-containing protein [Pontivivens insulae]|uniref:H-type lectin domain-containing protein n=1 Tax=Pontivivens insulae TaxID=1639689 RepID=A0A2R8A8I9_9RHOB|nr:H-type lectin domain-containing protein [Pontivivens insulae]RED18646.1 H-type lectin domain-containing protein [Pontivivens insulae]SPF28544.1 hypothetical protein POI8812_00845 [Pontivivens insulae]